MSDAPDDTKDILVVAISTVGGPALGQAVLDRHDQGPARFHVLVPERLPNHGATWSPEQVEKDADKRRDLLVELIGEMGVEVDGEVTRLSDAADAIDVTLHDRPVDEVIVVQGSKGLKKWDDKRRVKKLDRMIELPVTQIDPSGVDEGEYDPEAHAGAMRAWAEAVGRSPETG